MDNSIQWVIDGIDSKTNNKMIKSKRNNTHKKQKASIIVEADIIVNDITDRRVDYISKDEQLYEIKMVLGVNLYIIWYKETFGIRLDFKDEFRWQPKEISVRSMSKFKPTNWWRKEMVKDEEEE